MCGIVGIHNNTEAANLAYLCLYAMQHRGQESAGIVSSDGKEFHQHKAMGLVADVFDERIIKSLQGSNAIGHVRYSTTGSSSLENAQPVTVNIRGERLSLAHNGNLTNAARLKEELEKNGAIFQSTMDSEVIMHLVAQEKGELVDKIKAALSKVEGAYSVVFLSDGKMIAARDPRGFRPLVIGTLKNSFVVASETTAFDLIGAKYEREVEPGEIIVFERGLSPENKRGLSPIRHLISGKHKGTVPDKEDRSQAQCIFEYIYFARPDSHIFGRDVYTVRKGFGEVLARTSPVCADVVVPVPDSGVPAAIGFSEISKIPFEIGLIRNHYVGRTFIEPESAIRHFGVRLKLNPVRDVLNGKKVVVVDDSIVRGTTMMKIVKMIKRAGAKEVHIRISSPPTAWPCFYGMDTPTREELIASHKSVEDIRKFIDADSLEYLSLDNLFWFAKRDEKEWFCDACFSGNYPTQI